MRPAAATAGRSFTFIANPGGFLYEAQPSVRSCRHDPRPGRRGPGRWLPECSGRHAGHHGCAGGIRLRPGRRRECPLRTAGRWNGRGLLPDGLGEHQPLVPRRTEEQPGHLGPVAPSRDAVRQRGLRLLARSRRHGRAEDERSLRHDGGSGGRSLRGPRNESPGGRSLRGPRNEGPGGRSLLRREGRSGRHARLRRHEDAGIGRPCRPCGSGPSGSARLRALAPIPVSGSRVRSVEKTAEMGWRSGPSLRVCSRHEKGAGRRALGRPAEALTGRAGVSARSC